MSSPIKVGLLLHFYQPWWQYREVLRRIVDECYRPIFGWLRHHQGFALSANINWSLLELLERGGYDDVIEAIQACLVGGQLELLGTAAHHPILPLISEAETNRQIKLDRHGKLTLGLPSATCRGFYLPEYAYSPETAGRLQRAGYRFTVADDAIYAARHNWCVPFETIPRVDNLYVLLRSRRWGHTLSDGDYDFDRLNAEFPDDASRWMQGRPGYVVFATDAETFGHHHKRLIDWLLKPMVERWRPEQHRVGIVPLNDLVSQFGPGSPDDYVPPSTWSTEPHHFVDGQHYPLWKRRGNIYHEALWRLVDLARGYGSQAEFAEPVMRLLSSCSWWWVSGWPNFDPGMMLHGANLAWKIIQEAGDPTVIEQGGAAYRDLISLPAVMD
jgi:predicted glycosyl hydrolase (DUF1957 family)